MPEDLQARQIRGPVIAFCSSIMEARTPLLSHLATTLRRARRVLMLAALLMAIRFGAYAQQAPASAYQAGDEEPLAERVIDPVSYLTQLQIKDPYTPAQYGTNAQPNTVQLRAILALRPFLFIPFDQLVRPTIKIVTVPNGKGASTTTTYDDMQLLDLFVMPWPNERETHFRWGIGPYLIFPTSASDRVGNGSWQAGPALGFSYRGITGLNLSALLQQATSFAYTSSNSVPASSLTIQPLLSYQLGHDWYLKSSDATWTINWRHNTSTTFPMSAGFGKVWRFANDLALDTSISGEWMLYRQFAKQTEQFTLNFQVGLLFPKLDLD
jgi:hypothetical protein